MLSVRLSSVQYAIISLLEQLWFVKMEVSKGAVKASRIKRDARLEARVTTAQKQLMEKAAGLRGQNLTEFMVAVLSEAAMQIVKDGAFLELTTRDRQAFAEALLSPAPASERAHADAEWYKQVMNKTLSN